MKIESIIRRAKGTKITLPDAVGRQIPYNFQPDATLPDEPHVCEVANPAHQQRLLSITDGYREYVDPSEAAAATSPGIKQPVEPKRDPPDKVTEILKLSAKDLKATIATYTVEDLTAALAKEEAGEQPRKGIVEILKGATAG